MRYLSLFVFFLFFKQKTAYEMRISDWSSDVCSSDLSWADDAHVATQHVPELRQLIQPGLADEAPDPGDPVVVFSSPTGHAIALGVGPHATELDDPEEDRKSVV